MYQPVTQARYCTTTLEGVWCWVIAVIVVDVVICFVVALLLCVRLSIICDTATSEGKQFNLSL